VRQNLLKTAVACGVVWDPRSLSLWSSRQPLRYDIQPWAEAAFFLHCACRLSRLMRWVYEIQYYVKAHFVQQSSYEHTHTQWSCRTTRTTKIVGKSRLWDVAARRLDLTQCVILLYCPRRHQSWPGYGFHCRLSVSLSVCFPHYISKTDAARITKRDTEMFHDESWQSIHFWVKRSTVKGQSYES